MARLTWHTPYWHLAVGSRRVRDDLWSRVELRPVLPATTTSPYSCI